MLNCTVLLCTSLKYTFKRHTQDYNRINKYVNINKLNPEKRKPCNKFTFSNPSSLRARHFSKLH